MESKEVEIRAPTDRPVKISKWKVKTGSKVGRGALLAIYETEDTKGLRLKSTMVGTVSEVADSDGGKFLPVGTVLVKLEPCNHPVVMKDMCADCGADLRQDVGVAGNRKEPVSASVAMVHNIPELIISQEQALELGKADEDRLLKTRKLVLLVDLDHTLIHTTNDNIPPNLKGVYHFQLPHGNLMPWYHTKLRPGTDKFLERLSKLYEMHICTFGSRLYAHIIARFMDPEGKYFSHRILSRDECFSQNSKTANMKALFPCGDSMVCIIDDREDVWNFSPNLIHVKPYRFFQGTADINAPPGLEKMEHDWEPMEHKVRRTLSRSNSTESSHEKSETEKAEKNVNGKVSCETEDEKKSSDSETQGKVDGEKNDTEEKKDDQEARESQNASGDNAEVKTEKSDAMNGKDDSIKTENESKGDGCSGDEKVENTSMEVDSKKVETESKESKNANDVKEKRQSTSMEGDESHAPEVAKGEDSAKASSKTNSNNNPQSDCKDDSKGKTDEKEEEVEELEWVDEDDYLLYLEDILTRIHTAFYEIYDQTKSKKKSGMDGGTKPDLRSIIPYVKRKVLKGLNILFSGVIPTNQPPEKSRAFQVAKNLGANVQSEFVPKKKHVDNSSATTHVVAANLGTKKAKVALKHRNVRLVSLNWLWACAERLERCDERLFPVTGSAHPSPIENQANITKKRKNDETGEEQNGEEVIGLGKRAKVEDSSPEPKAGSSKTEEETIAEPITKKRFSTSYNPILAFSDDDIACMDKEVEDFMEDGEEDNEEEDDVERDTRIRSQVLSSGDDDSCSSEDSLTGEMPRGWNLKRNRRSKSDESGSSDHDTPDEVTAGDEESENELDKYEKTVEAFAPDTESDDYEDSVGSVDDEMAEAVEREFMSQF